MELMVLIALFNGGLIALSRTFNGALAKHSHALIASCCNHIVGFVVLSAWIICLESGTNQLQGQPPVYLYLGGVIGALFVVLNSWALPSLGVMRCTLLVICGQMLTGVMLDIISSANGIHWASLVGVCLMLAGVVFLNRVKQPTPQVKHANCSL